MNAVCYGVVALDSSAVTNVAPWDVLRVLLCCIFECFYCSCCGTLWDVGAVALGDATVRCAHR